MGAQQHRNSLTDSSASRLRSEFEFSVRDVDVVNGCLGCSLSHTGENFHVAVEARRATAAGGKDKWQGPAELTLNQNGDAISGTLVFTHPQGGRVQVPITSGIVSKDTVTFSGQNQFPMGSIEITFHVTVAGASLTGTADMTSCSVLIGPQANTASVNLTKQ